MPSSEQPFHERESGTLPVGSQQALLEVATALNQGLDRRQVFERIGFHLRRLIPFTSLTICRTDQAARLAVPVFNLGEYEFETLGRTIPFGVGLTGRVAETGIPVVYNDDESDDPSLVPSHIPGTPVEETEFIMVVPLVGTDGVEGTLGINREGSAQQRFLPEELDLAMLFAAQAQVAFHNAELFSAAEERAKRLATMNAIMQSVSGSLDLAAILNSWAAAVGALVPFTYASAALLRPDGTLLHVWHSDDSVSTKLGSVIQSESDAGWMVRHRRGFFLDDILTDREHGIHGFAAHYVRAMVATPLLARGQVRGAIGLGHETVGAYDARSLELLEEVALQVSAAVDNALLHQEVLEHRAQRSTFLAKLIAAQEEERKAIAVDLHDDTVQVLAAALTQLDRAISGNRPELLGKVRETLQVTMASARKLLFDLRPPVLDAEGLVPALRQQLEVLSRDIEVEVELVDDLRRRLEPAVETLIFRTVHEALANVREHADASHLWLKVAATGSDHVAVEVRDDGVGFDVLDVLPAALAGGHIGLHSMFERVHLAGGTVDLESSPHRGTRLTFSVSATLARSGEELPAPADAGEPAQ